MLKHIIRVSTFTIFLFALTAGTVLANKKDIEKERQNFWGRAAWDTALTKNGLGLFTMYSHRHNFHFDKKINDNGVKQEPLETFLQEFFFGPRYTKKINNYLKYNTKFMYRGQLWNYSEKANTKYFYRHTIDWHNNVWLNLKYIILHGRVIFWNLMPVNEKDVGIERDHELWNRNLIGIIIPFHKTIQLIVQEEIFLNYTPNEKSIPGGNNFFFRNAIWAGMDIKPVKSFVLSLKYVYYHSIGEVDAYKQTIKDHYIFAQATIKTNFSN